MSDVENATSAAEPEKEVNEEPAVALSRTTVNRLRSEFGEAVRRVVYFRDETTIEVDPARIVEICQFLRDHNDLKYNFLADLCGVDRLELDVDGPRYAVVYNLHSIPFNRRIRLKTCVDGDPPTVATVTSVWSAANWPEREAFDLVGIHFQGHPNLKRILTPEGFEGHPHRKDFDVGNEPVQFTASQEFVRHRHPTTVETYVDTHRKPDASAQTPEEDVTHG